MKCILCEKDREITTQYRGKAICNDCFESIYDFAKHQALWQRIIEAIRKALSEVKE